MRKDIKAINEAFRKVINENTEPKSAAEKKLYDLLKTKGVVDIAEFDELAVATLHGHGYQESDIAEMNNDDIREKIADHFDMELEEEGDNVIHVGNNFVGDIEPTPADKNASWNPRDWEDEEGMGAEDEEMGSEDAEESVTKKHDNIFYRTWENIVDRLSDEELESTAYMIRHFDALNKLIKEETRYRVSQFAANANMQYKLDRE